MSDADRMFSDNQESTNEERSTKRNLKRLVTAYMKCIGLLLCDDYDERILNIINRQDRHGNTALHYAVNNWPQKIVKELLRFGASVSIQNNNHEIPLTRLPNSTISQFLNEQCMITDGFDALDDDDDSYDEHDHCNSLNDEDSDKEENENFYKSLLDDYDPKFMTNIGQSPITFKYRLLVPSAVHCAKPKSTHGGSNQLNFDSVAIPSIPSEMDVLVAMCDSEQHQELVTHPVIKSFIWMKWKLVTKYYHRNLRLQLILVFCLTWYIFQQFGGLEWNYNCILNKDIHNQGQNFTAFCYSFWKEYYKLTSTHKFGELENKELVERWRYYFDALGSTVGVCMYADLSYCLFTALAIGQIYSMLWDARKDYLTNKRRKHIDTRTFVSLILPFGMDLANFALILLVLVLSETVLWFVISLAFLRMLVFEFTQLMMHPVNYFKRLSNFVDMAIIVLITIVLYVPNRLINDPFGYSLSTTVKNICPEPKENGTSDFRTYYQLYFNTSRSATSITGNDFNLDDPTDVSVKRFLSSFLIILTWSKLLFTVARHPSKSIEVYNKYAMMYGQVAWSFFRILIWYSFFIIAFALGFYIMFHNDLGSGRLNTASLSPYVFFNSPFEAFYKTVAMLVGEIDFNNMPIGISYARKDGNISVFLAYMFLFVFIFMIVMVLMNLLNGLAVTDIGAVVKQSEALHQVSLISILHEFEVTTFNCRGWLLFICKMCPCIEQLVMNHLDASKELLLFPLPQMNGNVQHTVVLKREKLYKREQTLPFETNRKNASFVVDPTSSVISKLISALQRYLVFDENEGCEHILSEARDILIKAKKSKMDQRMAMKKDEIEREMVAEKQNLERQQMLIEIDAKLAKHLSLISAKKLVITRQ